MKIISKKNLFFYVICIIFSILNIACSKELMKISVNVTAYNHTENGIGSYEVKLADSSSVEVGFLAPGNGGGGQTCCLSIPDVWQPGMKVTIVMNGVKAGKDIREEKTVSVPKYSPDDVGMLVVHFLHNGSYKVFVTKYLLGHRKYPLSGKEAELRPGVPLKIIWE